MCLFSPFGSLIKKFCQTRAVLNKAPIILGNSCGNSSRGISLFSLKALNSSTPRQFFIVFHETASVKWGAMLSLETGRLADRASRFGKDLHARMTKNPKVKTVANVLSILNVPQKYKVPEIPAPVETSLVGIPVAVGVKTISVETKVASILKR